MVTHTGGNMNHNYRCGMWGIHQRRMKSQFYASIHVVKFIILPLSLFIIAIPEISGLLDFLTLSIVWFSREHKNTVF
jgi:hypothetical protein